jgi:hypothetical protein
MSLQLYLSHKNIPINPQLMAISGYPPGIPLTVIHKINQLNLEKGAGSPIVLVLQGSYDTYPPTLSNAIVLSQFAKLSQTHRIFIQTLSEKNQIQLMISLAKVAGKVNALLFWVHGEADAILIAQNLRYSIEDIEENHFKDLPEDTPIFVTGCYSGQKFAPVLAKKINRMVYGNTEAASYASCIYFCEKHAELEITHITHSNTSIPDGGAGDPLKNCNIFMPDGSVKDPCAQYLEKIPELIDAMGIYFKNWHQSSDCYSCMGLLSIYNNDFPTAFQHYSTGALLNDSTSQGILGHYFENGIGCIKNIQQAIRWYQSAADLGHPIAAKRLQDLMSSCVPAITLSSIYPCYPFSFSQVLPSAENSLVPSSLSHSSSSSYQPHLMSSCVPAITLSSIYSCHPFSFPQVLPSAENSLVPSSLSHSSSSSYQPPLPLLSPSESNSNSRKRKLEIEEEDQIDNQQPRKKSCLLEKDLE